MTAPAADNSRDGSGDPPRTILKLRCHISVAGWHATPLTKCWCMLVHDCGNPGFFAP